MREIAIGSSRLQLLRADITKLGRHVGAIVNAANETLRPGGGVSGAIHAAGGPEIAIECRWIGRVEVGHAAPTTAGRLDADAVIHAVGPVWLGGHREEDRLLASTYRSCLQLVADSGLPSVAFPSISTGIYGYPVDRAAAIAIGTVAAFLKRSVLSQEIVFVLFSDSDYVVYSTALDRWERMQAAREGQGVDES